MPVTPSTGHVSRHAYCLRITCASLALTLVCALAAPPSAAEPDFYRYIDHTGAVRVVGNLGEVPPEYRGRAKPLGNSRRIAVQQQTPTLSQDRIDRAARTANRLAAIPERRPDTLIYTAEWCGYCRKAKSFLRAQGVSFEERDVDDPLVKRELVSKTGHSTIPVIERNGRRVIGWNRTALAELIR